MLREVKPDLWKKMEGAKLKHEHSTLLSLGSAVEHENLLSFLECKFIVNLSELALITSDSPVIFYNQLMEAAGNYIGATSFVAKGLQIFYPIHPRLMICLYDPKVYDLGKDKECCATESIHAIHQLNALQFINCKEQLFFDEEISKEYVSELCKQYSSYRDKPRHVSTLVKTGTRKFFLTGTSDAHINLELDFFKLLANPDDYKYKISPLRHSSFNRPVIKKINFDL